MALLYDFLAPLLAPVPLIRANQDGPAPKRPYGTYAIRTAADPRHPVTTAPDAGGNVTLRAHRAVSAEVQIYGPGSEAAADRLQLALKAETVAQSAERLGLALATVRAAQHVPALLDGQRWEERGIVEFTGYVLAEIADNLGLIERVETAATWGSDADAVPGPSVNRPVVTVTPAVAATGAASLEWPGIAVEAGLYPVVPSAPYPLTAVALECEAGRSGGAFTVSLLWLPGADPARAAAAGIADLRVSDPARRVIPIPDAARVRLSPGDRLALRVSDVAGEPADAVLTVHFTR